jgi:flagellar hook protein FlgE
MGIYGALSTAVTGLQAQSFALENISGNIANSQTIGYKRVETSFEDMIPDGKPTAQRAGSVVATARATNTVQGDISTSQTATNMAINGTGFFVVVQKTGDADGHPTFSGSPLYTRRGDFDVDKQGNLVNGAGYYLEGLPIDPATGNVSGSVPSVIKISNSLLPALPTTKIDYQLNLPQQPQDAAVQTGIVGSELLKPSDFLPNTAPAAVTGAAALSGVAAANTVMQPGDTLTINVGGTPTTFTFYDASAPGTPPANGVDVQSSVTIAGALADIQSQLQAIGPASASATVGLDGSGKVKVSLGSNLTDTLAVADGTTGGALGLGTLSAVATPATGPVATITGAQGDTFLADSIEGGAVTVYSQNGAPANVQFRWAKTASTETGGTDTWNLFYLQNSNATGTQPMWTNVGVDYKFGPNGALNPPVASTTINNLTVNGVSMGNLTLEHGPNGITQFADSNGTASVTTLTQNGYAAGKYTSVAVDDTGRVVASYSNGQQISVAQVVTANFNGANALKRLDGGAFAETTESGSPALSTSPAIAGSSLEASNTDLASEFSNLIVTQQAYAAGTKIVTTANDMLQQALNMIR